MNHMIDHSQVIGITNNSILECHNAVNTFFQGFFGDFVLLF
jgi:hypothetical protein